MKFALLLLITMAQYARCAIVVLNSYEMSTTAEGGSSETAFDDTIPIEGTTITSNGSRQTSSTATAADFVYTPQANPNDFSLSIAEGIVSADRAQNSGPPRSISSMLTYRVDFTIAAGELGIVTLDFDYLFTETGGNNGSLTWSLTGPGGSVADIGGSVVAPIASTSSSQTATGLTEGTYSLVLVAELPTQDFNNSNDSATIQLSNIELNFTSSIPEPSTSLLLGLAGALLLRRTRS